MTAEVSDVGDENIAGGFAMIERYARLAVRSYMMAVSAGHSKRP
jgi:hypothetical protein